MSKKKKSLGKRANSLQHSSGEYPVGKKWKTEERDENEREERERNVSKVRIVETEDGKERFQ